MKLQPFGNTILVNGLQLTSAVDRVAEARLQASPIPVETPEVWVYGPALGDLVRVLLERPALKRLNVSLFSAELFLQLRPLDEFANDDRVRVFIPGEIKDVHTPFLVSPGELRHADEAALPLRDTLLAVLNVSYNERIFSQLRPIWAKQAEENARYMTADNHVSALFGTDSRDALVISGGPTVGEHFEWIKRQARGHSIIAIARALIPLLGAGIVPDYVVEIDRSYASFFFPENEPRLYRTPLVHLNDIWPTDVANWSGPRNWLLEGDLFLGGSVAHTAADLATRLGARTVHLFGCDFCFPSNQSHMAGSSAAPHPIDQASFYTVNGLGERVKTMEGLMQFHRAMETLISERPLIRWVKHDRRGVPLRGAEWYYRG